MKKILSIKHIAAYMGIFISLFVFADYTYAIAPIDAHIDTCTAGQKQYQASGCSYQTKTCCGPTGAATLAINFWSDWDVNCPSCSSTQCWNGSSCVNKPTSTSVSCKKAPYNGKSGTLTLSYRCLQGSGWRTVASGTCTCYSGYTWNSTTMTCEENPTAYGTYRCSYVGGRSYATCLLFHQEAHQIDDGSSGNGDVSGQKCDKGMSYPCRNGQYSCYCN